jgi:hypothetical protein
VSRNSKAPGGALGLGLPEPGAEPRAAGDNDRLRSIETKLEELLVRRNRGRPKDAVADARNEIVEVGVLVLRDAILEQVPLSVQVAVMEPVVQEFERRLTVAMKAAADAEPAAAVNDRLGAIETRIGELLNRTGVKRGRPRDAVADALNQIDNIGVLVLRDAIKSVLKQVPRSVQVVVNLPDIMDQVVPAFEQRLVVVIKAGGMWHYETQRKVVDARHAMKSARRRRKKSDPSD